MAIEINSSNIICSKCGKSYGRRKGYFPVSYSILYKGIGYMTVCKDCIDEMYDKYVTACGDAKQAVRQMCRKLDLFWSDSVYEVVARKNFIKKGPALGPFKFLSVFRLVGDNLLGLFVEYVNLLNIKSKFNAVTRSGSCTGINSCSDRELFQIKV